MSVLARHRTTLLVVLAVLVTVALTAWTPGYSQTG